jgi:CheY-like chemotaxis protein
MTRSRVLVVDDDSGVRKVVTRALQEAGYAVLGASDGIQALELLEHDGSDFDLVLTDMRMPRLGGLELGLEIAARQWAIQVLYMSADPPPTPAGGTWTAMERWLSKPFSMATLIGTVGQLLGP